MGYDYCYGFCIEDEIIPLYDQCLRPLMRSDERRCHLFEIRTNFKLSSSQHQEVMTMGSERFGVTLFEYLEDGGNVVERGLELFLSCRLADYWMFDHEIRWLARDALNFVEEAAVEPRRAALSVIPVVVELDIWTVQQEGESIYETFDRAVRPECLSPLHLCSVVRRDSDQQEGDEQSSSDSELDAKPDSRSGSDSEFDSDSESDSNSESNSNSEY